MASKKLLILMGGCLCLTAALVAQRVWGQPDLPGLPPAPSAFPPTSPTTVAQRVNLPTLPNAPEILPTIPPSTQESTLPTVGSGVSATPPPVPGIPQVPTLPPTSNTPPASPNPLLPSIPSVPTAPITSLPPTTGTPVAGTPITGSPIPGVPVTGLPVTGTPVSETQGANNVLDKLGQPETRPGKQDSQVSVEWVAASMIRLNQPATCQILVKNNGNTAVNQVVVRHKLSPTTALKYSDPMPTQEQGNLSWNIGTLAGGQSRRIEMQIIASQRGALSTAATVTYSTGSTHTFQVREPLLNIKMKATEKLVLGELVHVQATISNPGDGPTEDIKIRIVMPEGLEHPKGRSFEEFGGTLEPNQTRTMTFTCSSRLPGAQKISLLATGAGGINSADQAVVEVIMPKLDLALIGPKFRFNERPAKYTLRISNPSPAPVTDIQLNEVVPAGLKFTKASDNAKWDEITRLVQWKLGELQPGQTREVNFEVIASSTGDHQLAAQVTGSRGVKHDAQLRTRVEVLSALNMEVGATENPIEVATESTFQVRVSNAGTKVEEGVELICNLPPQVQFVSAGNSLGSKYTIQNDQIVFEPVARLSPRAEVIYNVTVKGKVPGDARFRSSIRAQGLTEAVSREEVIKIYSDDTLPK